jgi:hypothetical protein
VEKSSCRAGLAYIRSPNLSSGVLEWRQEAKLILKDILALVWLWVWLWAVLIPKDFLALGENGHFVSYSLCETWLNSLALM